MDCQPLFNVESLFNSMSSLSMGKFRQNAFGTMIFFFNTPIENEAFTRKTSVFFIRTDKFRLKWNLLFGLDNDRDYRRNMYHSVSVQLLNIKNATMGTDI